MNELVGFGATGEVWRARPQAGGADVALRWLAADTSDLEKLEASGLRDFRHPHVAPLLDIRADGSSVVLVHQFITGVSLAALLVERDRLSGSEVVTLLTPIAEALAAAHDADLLHANLTPSAVLVTPDGRPILTDVGIWQSLRAESAVPAGSRRIEYLDPGVAQGGPPTKASDVFGVAAIGYHALTGRAPWSAGADAGTREMASVAHGVDLGPLHSGFGSKLTEVITRGLSERPNARGTARDFAADVRDAAEPEPLHLTGPYLWPDLLPPGPHGEDCPDPASASTQSPGFDISGEVRRGASARHAAPPGVRRERASQLGTVGLGLDPPSGFALAVRFVPRRAVVGACVTLAVLAAVVLGLGWNSSKTVPAQAGASIGLASEAAPDVDERAVPDSPEAWARLLNVLYERRALAFGTGDVSLLEQVFSPDSRQLVTDVTAVTRLVEAGEVLRGFSPQVLAVQAAAVDGDHATLQITDEFSGYQSVPAADAGAPPLADHSGRGPAVVAMTMVLTDDGWRIQTAERLA